MKDILKVMAMGIQQVLHMSKVHLFVVVLFLLVAVSTKMGNLYIIIIAYILCFLPKDYDEQAKGEYMICSLPISRTAFVVGRYLFSLVMLCAVFIYWAFGTMCINMILPQMELWDNLKNTYWVSITAQIVYISFLLPINFLCFATRFRGLSNAIYAATVLVPVLLWGPIADGVIKWMINPVSMSVMLLLAVGLSLCASLFIFKRRQYLR